ncbi:MAG: hypothetical protein IJS40_00440 [Synergistaceae bacterium]|nr:hypothetical protein [Synergistaceae bacterium]
MSNEYYEDLIANLAIPSFKDLEDKMLINLYSIYERYPTPTEYMRRIVNRLSDPDDHWEDDSLRLRIVKQFIKYGDYLSSAGYNGRKFITDYAKDKISSKSLDSKADVVRIIAALDDGIFKALDTASSDQKSPEGKFGLLKIADDLALGKFHTEGSTKKQLYLFAMAYGMTYYSGADDTRIDAKTDIEINLFRDYYTNNLMRFISDVYKGKLDEYELDPSGQGINYKNFAEMIYLYYISQNFTTREKIAKSSAMIEKIKKERRQQGSKPSVQNNGTETYRNLFSEEILNKSEAEFEEFIKQNYDCDTSQGNYSRGVLQLGTTQNSAFKIYSELLGKLRKLMTLENCNYGLWFTDVAAFWKYGCESICERNPEIEREKFAEFMELLLAMNNFLGYAVKEDESTKSGEQERAELSTMKTKTLYASESTVTRSSIIVAFYYYYNALHEKDGQDKWKNFAELFNEYKRLLNPELEKAYYQPLSGRNIFDLLVVFSSYAYLNM